MKWSFWAKKVQAERMNGTFIYKLPSSHKGKGGTGMDGERFDQKNFMTIVTVKPEMVGWTSLPS